MRETPYRSRPVVYFIQADMPGGRGPIKVGYMGNGEMWRRIKELQTGCPWDLKVIRCTPGTQANERWVHREFGASRMRGEWFQFSADLVEYALALPAASWVQLPTGSAHRPRADVVPLARRRSR